MCRGRGGGLSGGNGGKGRSGFRERRRVAGEGGLYSADLGRNCKCFLHSNLRRGNVWEGKKSHHTKYSNP